MIVEEFYDSSLGDATLPRQASARAQLPDFPGPTSKNETAYNLINSQDES